jgi:hypothetical protein
MKEIKEIKEESENKCKKKIIYQFYLINRLFHGQYHTYDIMV